MRSVFKKNMKSEVLQSRHIQYSDWECWKYYGRKKC